MKKFQTGIDTLDSKCLKTVQNIFVINTCSFFFPFFHEKETFSLLTNWEEKQLNGIFFRVVWMVSSDNITILVEDFC